MAKHTLRGSERRVLPGAKAVGAADPDERLEVSVVLRSRARDGLKTRIGNATAGAGKSRSHLTRDEFARDFGAHPDDLSKARSFAQQHGLAVVQEHAGRRTVVLSGTVAAFNAAFSTTLQLFEHDGGTYRGRTGDILLPDELAEIVEAVLGLDNRPQARPHFRSRPSHGNVEWHAAGAGPSSFTPPELASLYGFPAGTGSGECIALIELGGGYRRADLRTYFAKLGIPLPAVTAVSVDHGRNHPTGDASGPDGEVMLDIEVAGAVAPGAKIVVYFAPNTDAGFLDAITSAIHDTKHKPSIVSISWGGAESAWTQQSMTAFDQAFQEAAAMGVTVFAASGDNGSSDGVNDGADHVDFPASSPHVVACGGTRVTADNGTLVGESVWNDGANGGSTGGGVSAFFALPAWQTGCKATSAHGGPAPLAMRGVPDVAGDADPQSGYVVRVDGVDTVFGGTSAVAPLWAAMLARCNANHGKPAGFINAGLYQTPTAFRDITLGNNGDFSATAGWDACTGLGSPNGAQLARVL